MAWVILLCSALLCSLTCQGGTQSTSAAHMHIMVCICSSSGIFDCTSLLIVPPYLQGGGGSAAGDSSERTFLGVATGPHLQSL